MSHLLKLLGICVSSGDWKKPKCVCVFKNESICIKCCCFMLCGIFYLKAAWFQSPPLVSFQGDFYVKSL